MKIYTITCNNAYNYGAVLQAYALQKYLEKQGHTVEIIDYYPSNLRKISDKYKNNLLLVMLRKILYFPDYQKSKRIFGKFAGKYLHLTKPCYSIGDVDSLPRADLYIAGSDQIWNARMKNAGERAYFLDLTAKVKKIAYAASIGMITIDKELLTILKEKLPDFKGVSVREKVTSEILNSNGIVSECVIDPVYLLSAAEWKENLSIGVNNRKYVLVYALHHVQPIYDYARQLANEIDAEVYVVSVEIKEIRRGNDKFFWNPDVTKFLELVANAQAVVSNSFHGISFSCIFDVPVHIFDTEKDDPRISNIIDLLSLGNRKCSIEQSNCLDNQINLDTQYIIAREVRKSQEWLKQKIKDVEGV